MHQDGKRWKVGLTDHPLKVFLELPDEATFRLAQDFLDPRRAESWLAQMEKQGYERTDEFPAGWRYGLLVGYPEEDSDT